MFRGVRFLLVVGVRRFVLESILMMRGNNIREYANKDSMARVNMPGLAGFHKVNEHPLTKGITNTAFAMKAP